MKRGLIMAVLVTAIFIASFSVSRGEASTEEVVEVKISSAKPVMVPYLDMDINEALERKEKQNATSRLVKRDLQRTAEAQQTFRNSEQNPDECGNGNREATEFISFVDSSGSTEYGYYNGNDDEYEVTINEDEETDSESEYSSVYEEASEPETDDEEEFFEYTDQLSESVEDCSSEIHEDVGETYQCLGDWTITAYCPCAACCGQWATGWTASGTIATAGRTVACNCLPFGTRLLIGGQEYVVEDTGWSPYGEAWIDIFFNTHEEALAFGEKVMEVYEVKDGEIH